MARKWIKKLRPRIERLGGRWYLRPVWRFVGDSRLWSMQRRSITGAVAAGIAICFVPLPIHLPLAALVAIVARLNVATIFATVMLVNPLTVVPVYYFAYRVGTFLVGQQGPFHFELSWSWLQHGLGPMWRAFLTGCAVCALTGAVLSWLILELLWRWRTIRRYRTRRVSQV
ncbi:MAG: DUF2062 domain-containing protein [Steroidobacteraceae bacterium]